MSKTYIFAQVKVKDFESYIQRYGLKLLELIPHFNGRIITAGPEFEMLEGDAFGNWSVLAEFDNYDDAIAFYDSEEYAPLKALRQSELSEGATLTLMRTPPART